MKYALLCTAGMHRRSAQFKQSFQYKWCSQAIQSAHMLYNVKKASQGSKARSIQHANKTRAHERNM